MNITVLKLALPHSVAQILAELAPDGVDVGQYSVAVLTEHAASNGVQSRDLSPGAHAEGGSSQRRKKTSQHSSRTRISEDELLHAIMAYLKTQGGSCAKPDVEDAIFRKHETVFSDPYYRELVGGGVPRWKKNVQFAANTGRNKGLLKRSEDSGRGVWELTENG